MAGRIKKAAQFLIFLVLVLVMLGGGFYWLQAKTELFLVTTNIEKNKNINPDEKVIIRFSQPVSRESYANKIGLFPEDDFEIDWNDNDQSLIVSPKKYWKPETKYRVIIDAGKSRFFTDIKKQEFSFSTLSYPEIKKVFPENETQDVTISMEDPIVVSFQESFEDFYIRFNFYPATEITYQINPEKTEFRILPKQPLEDGKEYRIDIFAKYIKDSDDTYHSIFSSKFKTLLPVPLVWEKDLDLRVEQAGKFTKPQIVEGKYIDINLTSQIMVIFEQGVAQDVYVVSSGKRGMDTSKGKFKIENKAQKPWSKEYGLFMPNWMALVPSGKFGIHELPEWPGGYKEGQNHLGTPVSHGCVRLGVGAAKRVYDWAEIGTPVVIY